MSVTVESYIDYFRQLAVSHHDLQHNPASETEDAEPGTKRFTRWGVDEVVTGLRSKIGDRCLMLEMYEIVTNAPSPYDVKGNYSGAFSVVFRATPGDTFEEVIAFQVAETVYQDLLKKIYQDHFGENTNSCTTPFATFDFDRMNIIPIGPIHDNFFGWRIEFQFRPKHLIKITEPPASGTFI